MKTRAVTIVLVVVGVCYLAAPYIAGVFRVGYRMGPVIYPESFHESLYIMGHESRYDQKPRQPLDVWMYRRPLFYGLPRRLKSEQEREAYIEMARRNQSPRLQWLIDQNERIKAANKASAGNGAVTLRFHAAHLSRAVPEMRRWTDYHIWNFLSSS